MMTPAPMTNGFSDSRASPASHLQGPRLALAYMRERMSHFFSMYSDAMSRLSTATLFMPLDRLLSSPYADIFDPIPCDPSSSSSASSSPQPARNPNAVHASHLVPLFSSDFCAHLKMSRELPLKVATDIGGGGALAKIAKVRSVMKEKRNEWSQVEELPVSLLCPPPPFPRLDVRWGQKG
jgi:hypothetical protein